MWAAIVLVCHLDMAPIFENNLTDQIVIPERMCYMSMAPALLKSEKTCLLTIAEAMRRNDFVKVKDFQIFSFKCFKWDNHHYKGESI
tara:strand:- start:1158 stop:1418 length:261 start_codon:yes stop_codon:yes gene_type:complete